MKTVDYFDKSCYGEDRSNEMPHTGGNFLYIISYPIAKILFRLTHKNIKSAYTLAGKTGFVVIANHISYLDVYSIYEVLKPKINIRFMARSNLFENKFIGKLFAWVGAFPVHREKADRKAIKRAVKMLKNKEVVGIMPEGTRRAKGSLSPDLHSGAAFIARMGGNVPILPCTTIGANKVKQKGKFFRPSKITVKFGNPILLKDFDFLDKKERLDAATWYAMRQCFSMFYNIEPSKVDMKKLFPNNKDYSEVFLQHPIKVRTSDEVVKNLKCK